MKSMDPRSKLFDYKWLNLDSIDLVVYYEAFETEFIVSLFLDYVSCYLCYEFKSLTTCQLVFHFLLKLSKDKRKMRCKKARKFEKKNLLRFDNNDSTSSIKGRFSQIF